MKRGDLVKTNTFHYTDGISTFETRVDVRKPGCDESWECDPGTPRNFRVITGTPGVVLEVKSIKFWVGDKSPEVWVKVLFPCGSGWIAKRSLVIIEKR